MTSAATALAPTGWDTDVLLPIERALASIVGPMARVMVKRAARQSPDLAALTELLALQIDSATDRARFVARLEAGTGTHTARSMAQGSAAAAGSPPTSSGAAQALSEQALVHATRVMTAHLGPIAKILVKKAAASHCDQAGFHNALLGLADGVDKTRLLRELQDSS